MIGNEISPIEITDAATTPVVAASNAPTKITAYASPPRIVPKSCPIVSSRSSAMPLRSSTSPISVKNGMANSVSLLITLKMRSGNVPSRLQFRLMVPPESGASSTPITKKNKPHAASENATG